MGRPRGSKNRPEAKKPGRKAGFIYENYPQEKKTKEYQRLMKESLELIAADECQNLTQAAERLGVSPMTLYALRDKYPDWANQLKAAEQIIADRIEEALDHSKNVVGQIFRLKKLRPEYRDSYKIDVTTTKLEQMLTDLKKLGTPTPVPQIEMPTEPPVVIVESEAKVLDNA